MITIVSRALVKFAADRWPPHLRDEVRQEWLAELAVLTASHKRLKSLGFAASLAAHAAHRPDGATAPLLPRLWYAIRVLLIGPVLCWPLVMASFLGMSLINSVFTLQLLPFGAELFDAYGWATRLQLPTLTVLSLLSAYVASLIGRRWSPGAPGFLLPVLIATVPVFLGAAAMYSTSGNSTKVMRYLSVFEVYLLGFAAVLYLAARWARSGRRKQAWWLGVVGAFVLLDIAVMPAVSSIRMPAEEGAINPAYAPMWLITLLTDTGLGPTPAEVFTITDVLVGVPQVVIILTGWALGMVMGRAEGVQNRASSSSSALATASESPPSTLM